MGRQFLRIMTIITFFSIFNIMSISCMDDQDAEPVLAAPNMQALMQDTATTRDINHLLFLYQQFDDSDKSNIVYIPNNELLKKKLKKDITAERIFVIRDKQLPADNDIVAFLKMHLVIDDQEKDRILCDELRIKTKITKKNNHYNTRKKKTEYEYREPILRIRKTYKRNFGNIYDFNLPLVGRTRGNSLTNEDLLERESTYIYIGSAYTIKTINLNGTLTGYRNHGINTLLERYAMLKIQDKVVRNIERNRSEAIILLYGTIAATANTLTHVRVFLENIAYIRSALGNPAIGDEIEASYEAYEAFKPAFSPEDPETPLPDDHEETQAGRGYGHLLYAHLYPSST